MKVISVSLHNNVGPDGKKQSITRHIPLDDTKPVYRRFKNVGAK